MIDLAEFVSDYLAIEAGEEPIAKEDLPRAIAEAYCEATAFGLVSDEAFDAMVTSTIPQVEYYLP